jgi:predicted metal-dependent phosphoesterase TrpH
VITAVSRSSPLRIDLHTHSTASDGTTTPADLLGLAAAAAVDVLALTDHDTTGGWSAAAAALPNGLTLVRGAEISCRDLDAGGARIGVHLLAYLFDPTEPVFKAARERLRDGRVTRGRRMVERLRADGHDVTWARVQEIAAGTVGRPHVARALVEIGLVDSIGAAFAPDWIGVGGRYYAGKDELDLPVAIGMVLAAGGVPVLAHPRSAQARRHLSDARIAELAGDGLRGLEVDHADHPPDVRAHLRAMAADLRLVATGSSDFHGANKTQRLGDETTDPAAYEALVAAASGVTPVAA